MPVITKIKPQKNKKRVNIYLDGKFSFGLDLENFMKLNLKVEQSLTSEEVEEIVKKAEYKKAFDKLLRFAMTRPRSEFEIEQWFKRKKVHESLHEKLCKKLEKFDLLDDRKFAKWWVEQRSQFRPRSERMLRNELYKKGIAKEIINNVLANNEIDEVKIAGEMVAKKSYKWEKYDEREAKQKKSEFLARKGFSWDVIKEVV